MKLGGCSIKAAVLVATIVALIAIVYLSGALTWTLIPASVQAVTGGAVSARAQMSFMTDPLTVAVVACIMIAVVGIAASLRGK